MSHDEKTMELAALAAEIMQEAKERGQRMSWRQAKIAAAKMLDDLLDDARRYDERVALERMATHAPPTM